MTLISRIKTLGLLAFLSCLALTACASSPPPPSSPPPSPPGSGLDWFNPTGMSVRGCDAQGCGSFGAPRGVGSHYGSDYEATTGQEVYASVSGIVEKIGYPYADDLSFRYIKIAASDGTIVRELYVFPAPGLTVGDSVAAGTIIGTEQILSGRYPGITEHSHLDIETDDGYVDPETLIP